MKNKLITALIGVFMSSGHIQAQEVADTAICYDVFLSKEIMQEAHMADVAFLNSISLTESRYILLGSTDSLYFVGYGGYDTYAPEHGKIKDFCIVGTELFYATQRQVYQVTDSIGERVIVSFPADIDRVFGGYSVLYATSKTRERRQRRYYDKYILNVIQPSIGKKRELFSLDKPIVSVLEDGQLLYVLTASDIVMVNVHDKQYVKLPLGNAVSNIQSAVIDDNTGIVYFSSDTGVYRIRQDNVEKVCNDQGLLCHDKDGLLVFIPQESFVIRLRNNILYPRTELIIHLGT